MSSKWKPEKYKDEYKEAVEKWVKAKANKLPAAQMEQRGHAVKPSGRVVNFVDLLKKSLENGKPNKKSQTISKKKSSRAKHLPPKHATQRKEVAH